jgi:hypothetical protein
MGESQTRRGDILCGTLYIYMHFVLYMYSKDDFMRRPFKGNIIIAYTGFFTALHSTGCEHFVLSSRSSMAVGLLFLLLRSSHSFHSCQSFAQSVFVCAGGGGVGGGGYVVGKENRLGFLFPILFIEGRVDTKMTLFLFANIRNFAKFRVFCRNSVFANLYFCKNFNEKLPKKSHVIKIFSP